VNRVEKSPISGEKPEPQQQIHSIDALTPAVLRIE